MSSKGAFENFTQPPLPLLVRMPNGERRQVDIPPTATIRDLKSTLSATLPPHQAWNLDFGGATLSDTATLTDYHIPDAYDHASGLLRSISQAAHIDGGKKVEALDKAVAVVKGISRGEHDMARLISAVFDDEAEQGGVGGTAPDDDAQPALGGLRRTPRSKLPDLNFSSLGAPTGQMGKIPGLSAPPTPSQLLRRLSSRRPDLFDSAAAARLESPAAVGLGQLPEQSGELKRGATWFTNVISEFGNAQRRAAYDGDGGSEGNEEDDSDADDDDDHVGESEGEAEPPARGSTDARSKSETMGNGMQGSDHARGTRPAAVMDAASKAAKVATAAASGSKVGRMGGAVSGRGDADMPRSPPKADAEPSKSGSMQSLGLSTTGSAGSPGVGTTGGRSTPPKMIDASKQVIGIEPEVTSHDEDVRQPKKRGRKRKNPHLTDEERKAARQAQNRESAKMSRIRRKKMTIEYEKRVNTLEGENENLRDTVAALTERLEVLRNLLTISVSRPGDPQQTAPYAPQPPTHSQAPVVGGQVISHVVAGMTESGGGGFAMGAGGSVGPQPAASLQVHQLTNMDHRNF